MKVNLRFLIVLAVIAASNAVIFFNNQSYVAIVEHQEDCDVYDDISINIFKLDSCFGPISGYNYKFNISTHFTKYGYYEKACDAGYANVQASYLNNCSYINSIFDVGTSYYQNVIYDNETLFSLFENQGWNEIFGYYFYPSVNCTDEAAVLVVVPKGTCNINFVENIQTKMKVELVDGHIDIEDCSGVKKIERLPGECYTVSAGSIMWFYEFYDFPATSLADITFASSGSRLSVC